MDTQFPFTVKSEQYGPLQVLKLRGELDVASCVILEEEFGRVGDVQGIVVDLSELEFIDSSGIGLLVGAHEEARAKHSSFALVNGDGQVRQLLELTGLATRLTIFESLAELQTEH